MTGTAAAPGFGASITWLFGEWAPLERFARAREAGFDAVEIQRIDDFDAVAAAAAVRDARVRVSLVNVASDDFAAGGPGLAGVPGREPRFREALLAALEFADRVGAGCVHLGPSRIPAGTSREECLAVYLDNLAFALRAAEGHRTCPVIEAMNRLDAKTALFPDLESLAAPLAASGGRLRLLYDVYHVVRNGEDPLAAYVRHRDVVEHVQFSDAPGRHEPGTGTIDFDRVFTGLAAAGYAGMLGAEYLPTAGTLASLAWLPGARARVADATR